MGVVDEGGGVKRKHLHISLLHNPSHLELIGAVAAGKARAKNDGGSKALCLQVGGMVSDAIPHELHEFNVEKQPGKYPTYRGHGYLTTVVNVDRAKVPSTAVFI